MTCTSSTKSGGLQRTHRDKLKSILKPHMLGEPGFKLPASGLVELRRSPTALVAGSQPACSFPFFIHVEFLADPENRSEVKCFYRALLPWPQLPISHVRPSPPPVVVGVLLCVLVAGGGGECVETLCLQGSEPKRPLFAFTLGMLKRLGLSLDP